MSHRRLPCYFIAMATATCPRVLSKHKCTQPHFAFEEANAKPASGSMASCPCRSAQAVAGCVAATGCTYNATMPIQVEPEERALDFDVNYLP